MDYPSQLTYNNINPKGFFSTFKQWLIQPVASGGVFWGGQNVKILIQSIISGVMDPYRSHLQFQVEVDSQYLPVGGLQLDSSAQSFIEQLVISSKNKQIERIPQYSVLAAWLTDCGLAQMYAQGRQTEGLGYTNVQSLHNFSNPIMSVNNLTNSGSYGNNHVISVINSSQGIHPTQLTSTISRVRGNNLSGTPMSDIVRLGKGHMDLSNPLWFPNTPQNALVKSRQPNRSNAINSSLHQYGCNKNIRAQYLQCINSKAFPDATNTRSSQQIQLQPSVFQNDFNAQWDTKIEYKTKIKQSYNIVKQFGNNNTGSAVVYEQLQVPNTVSLNGFNTLYSPNFCKGVHQPMISATIPQCQMKNGRILPVKVPHSKRTFKIPIISAILGILIPQDQFVLLPIKALNQILLQFVIDKYAMFTTGYSDISQFDQQGMKVPQQRAFSIKRVLYRMQTYQFYSPQIDQYLTRSLSNRILLNCNMWTLGNQYQIIKGQNLNNTFPVACTSEALNQIVVLFVPLDYQTHSFCRKHFRISNNITKFQLRVNMDYFPSQPLTGNGGNPCQMQGQDNSAFVQQIFWSNNFMFNKVNPWPRINAYNFAINQRCYDINRKETFYDKNMYSNLTYKWTQKSVNIDTAMGMPWVHQNRYVGKAGYVYGFQPYAHSAYHLTGLDCRQVRQFDVILNTHPFDNFPREQTLYIFTRSSVIVQYTQNGINVYGR